MRVTIQPGTASGTVAAVPSKSAAHRLLIAAALADRPTWVLFEKSSQDIDATIRCLTGLGAEILRDGKGCLVNPLDRTRPVGACALDCGESGSTLRFLLPVAGALGAEATFLLSGRLADRPLEPLAGQLKAHGCALELDRGKKTLTIRGRLTPGEFSLPGNVSSQFFSGLLFALPLLEGESRLWAEETMESAGYIDLTLSALARFGIRPKTPAQGGWSLSPQEGRSPETVGVEGDWSNAAPWLCMGVLGGETVAVSGLDPDSLQGDRAICRVLAGMGGTIAWREDAVSARGGNLRPAVIDARNIPDLVPVLAAAASAIPGETRIAGAARLRLKESDRLETTARTLNALGGAVTVLEDGLLIRGVPRLTGGAADAAGDHRIAMAAAVASAACDGPVTVTGAQAVDKSYPGFWSELRALGRTVETEEEDP